MSPLAVLWVLPALADIWSILHRPRPAAAGTGDDEARRRPRLLIAVPAHNEAGHIEACVSSLVAMRSRRCDSEVIVVADNCSDGTADLARRAGAHVLARTDTERKGKPAAIGWMLGEVGLKRFDAVVIVDADSTVDPGFADAYALVPRLRHSAAQGYNDISNVAESWLSLLAGLLVKIRYDGQYRLKQRAGLNCPLTGNSMCVGTEVLEELGWSSDSLTENWDMYARYTAAGVGIALVRDAHIFSHEAGTMRQSSIRRRRWQTGRWQVFLRHASTLLTSPIPAHQKLDAIAEISSPGPVVHGSTAALAIALLAPAHGPLAALLTWAFALALVHQVAWTVFIWVQQPQRVTLALALARLPLYALWRLALAARSLIGRRRAEWERSPHQP